MLPLNQSSTFVEVWGIEPQLLFVILLCKTNKSKPFTPCAKELTLNPIIPLHIEGSNPPKLKVVQ